MRVRNVVLLLLLPVMLGAVENSGAYQGPIQVVYAPIPSGNEGASSTNPIAVPFMQPPEETTSTVPYQSPVWLYQEDSVNTGSAQIEVMAQDFRGIYFTYLYPPDVQIAVGPEHVGEVVNSSIEFFTKEGGRVYSNSLESFFYPINPGGGFIFDPKIAYDPLEGRWIVLALYKNDSSHESRYYLAVSQTSNPLGNWYYYNLDATLNGNNPTNTWADYPGLGFNDWGVFITSNQFTWDENYNTAKLRVLDKDDLYNGTLSGWHDFWGYPLRFSSKPAQSISPSFYGYVLSSQAHGGSVLNGVYIKGPASSPSLGWPYYTIQVTTYDDPPDAQQPDGDPLNAGDARLQDVIYMNGKLYTTLTEKNPQHSEYCAIRYFRINVSTPTIPILEEDITFGSNGYNYIYPRVGVSENSVAIVFTRVGPVEFANVSYIEKFQDATFFKPSVVIKEGEDNYVRIDYLGRNRWGDYFGAGLDPVDGSIWVAGEYASTNNEWGTWIAKVVSQGIVFDWPEEEGLILGKGTRYRVNFRAQSEEGITDVKLAMSTDGGFTFPETVAVKQYPSYPNDTTDYLNWTVDFSIPETDQGMVKIVARDQANHGYEDVSEYTFQIMEFPWGGWEEVNSGLENSHVNEIAVRPDKPWILYAACGTEGNTGGQGIYKSTDWGTTWQKIESFPDFPVFALAIDPSNADVIYAGTRRFITTDHLIYKSTDGGNTWFPADSGMVDYETSIIYDIEIAPNGDLWAVGSKNIPGDQTYIRIFKSTNGGESWQLKTNGFSGGNIYCEGYARTVAIHPQNPNILYVGIVYDGDIDNCGIWKSTDGGNSWRSENRNLHRLIPDVYSIALDSNDVYIGVYDYHAPFGYASGIYKLKPGEPLWERADFGVEDRVRTLHALPDKGLVLSGSIGSGKSYISLNQGKSWIKQQGTPFGSEVTDIEINPVYQSDVNYKQIYYVSTNGRGIWRYNPDVSVPPAPDVPTVTHTTPTSISLTWSGVPGALGYRIYYGTQPGSYPNIVDVHGSTSATITGLSGEAYYLVLKAYNLVGESDPSSEIEVVINLNAPSDLRVSSEVPWTSITLTWTDRSRYNSGYEIQRIDEEGNVRTITINDSNATSYVDHTVAPFHTYDYKIRAINNDGVASEWVTERVYNTPTFLVPINPSLSSVSSKVMHKDNKEYIAVSQPVVGNDGKLQGVVILLKTSLDGINWTTEDTVYRLTTGSSISLFNFDIIPVDLQNGVKFAGLATYQLDNRAHVDFITYSGVGLHGVIEVFSGDGEAKHPTLIWNRESNNVGINFSVANRIYWAEYTLSNTVSILGYVDAHNLFNTYFVVSLSPLKVDGVDVAEFPWGVVLNGRNTHSENEIIALYGDDGYSYVILDTTPAWRGYVDSYNNRVVWASEEGIKEAVIDGVADMIWVDRTEVITQDITGENVFSLNYSQNSYGDEVIGATVKDTGFVSKYIAFTRPSGNTQWSLRNIEIKHESPVLYYGRIAFSNRYRGRAGIYQKYLIIYHIEPCCTDTDTMFFKERSFKVKDEIVIRPDIMKGDLSSIHHGDSNYIFFSRYGYVNYVQSDNTVTGWSRENIICKGYNPVAVHTDSSFTVFYVRNDSLFARTDSDGFENEHFVMEMGQFSPGYGVSYSDGNYYIVYEEMAGQMTDDTLFTPRSWSLKTAVVSSDFSLIRDETIDHTEDGLPTGVNPYRSQGRRVSIGSFNGYRYVLAVEPGGGVKLYRDDSGAWELRTVNIGNGPYGNLNIKVDDETVYLTWSEAGTVYYRFLYAGDPGFISKAIELSSGDNPNYGGKAIFWSDGNKLEKMSLALEDEPAELMTAGTGDISNTALTFYTVGGEYYQTSVYLSALMIKDGSSNMLGVNVYSTGPIPEQVITLGDTIPTPKTIERSGFEEYSDEKGKSADVGDRLSYRITDLKPNEYYRLGLYIYHEEEDDITEQFYLDGKPVKSELIQKGKETYIELEVPEEMYVEDSTVVLEVEKESGPVAVLNEIYVFGKPIAGSGPMSEEEVMLIPETYRVMSISPNPMRGRGEIVLGIPEDGKVRVDLYNIEGRRVKELFNGMVRKGYYRVRVEGLESGMYFVVVRGEHGKAMKKMMVLR